MQSEPGLYRLPRRAATSACVVVIGAETRTIAMTFSGILKSIEHLEARSLCVRLPLSVSVRVL